MRTKGTIATWNDEKGYGFISPFEGGDRIFAHIKAFESRGRRPAVGDVVTFSMSTDARGRPCVKEANIAGVQKIATRKQSSVLPNVMAAGFLLFVVGAVLVSAIPVLILPFYVIVSVATFGAYALDKSAAKRGAWRTSESTLHLLALIGGWPGALIAQNRLRHKSRKQPFRAIFLGNRGSELCGIRLAVWPGGCEGMAVCRFCDCVRANTRPEVVRQAK